MQSVSQLLRAVRGGRLGLKEAERLLKLDAIALVDDVARIDYNRYLRRGVPEIIYAKGKTTKQLLQILTKLISKRENDWAAVPIIISKVSQSQAESIIESLKNKSRFTIRYFENADLVVLRSKKNSRTRAQGGKVALLAAGTSDTRTLNESELVLNLFGCRTIRYNDVGVAGLHRLIQPLKEITSFDPDAIIVAAGMEGALPSVVAGLSSVPIIGLPTSAGYGYGGDGEAALMSMLQACSLGVCVVNIDGGVAAGVIAWLIARRKKQSH